MRIILREMLDKIVGEIEFVYKEENIILMSKADVIAQQMDKGYVIESITARNNVIVLELIKWKPLVTDMNDEWVVKYTEENGVEPSFF